MIPETVYDGGADIDMARDKAKEGDMEEASFKEVKGWYRGPLRRDGTWRPRGGVELIVDGDMSEEDNERATWVSLTAEERREFTTLFVENSDVPLESPAFARLVGQAIKDVRENQ